MVGCDNDIDKELKDKFIMVGMTNYNERKECAIGKKIRI